VIHGHATKRAKLDRDWARLLLGLIHPLHGGKSSGFLKAGQWNAEGCGELFIVKGTDHT
jgi:hypothetical protein